MSTIATHVFGVGLGDLGEVACAQQASLVSFRCGMLFTSLCSAGQLAARAGDLCHRRRRLRGRRPHRALPPATLGPLPRGDRGAPGSAARPRRPDPGVRPHARSRPLPGPSRRRRSDANTIGTAYLRAQTLGEPQRRRSLALLRSYNDLAIRLTHESPGSASHRATAAEQGRLSKCSWRFGGEAINARPRDSAPRLYIDSLNAMIDQQGGATRRAEQPPAQRGPPVGVARGRARARTARAVRTVLGRGPLPVILAVVVVSFLVLVTFDLDRPTRGLIAVPASPLIAEKATMSLPPAAPPPATRP